MVLDSIICDDCAQIVFFCNGFPVFLFASDRAIEFERNKTSFGCELKSAKVKHRCLAFTCFPG